MANYTIIINIILIQICLIGGLRDRIPLHVIHLTHHRTSRTWHALSITEYAFHLVNQQHQMLEQYSIACHSNEVMVEDNVGQSVKAFIDAVSHDPVKIAILGPFFTSQAKVVAETASFYNLVEVGYSLTSPELSNTAKFPYLARTIESTALNNLAIAKVIEHFNWRKIATITFDMEFVTGAKEDLLDLLKPRNVSILVSSTYRSSSYAQVKQLKDSKARIIVSYTNLATLSDTSRVLCEVYKQQLYGRRYQWIHWSERFGLLSELRATDKNDGCTREQLEEAAEGTLIFSPKKISEEQKNNVVGVTGMTAAELEADYFKFINESGDKYAGRNIVSFFPYTFDAAWGLFLALNQSIAELERLNTSLEEFTYESKQHADIIFKNLKSQEFFGQSGRISFDKKGDRLTELNIYQIRKGQPHLVGEYSPFTDELRWFLNENSLFAGNRPPYDEDIIKIVHLKNDGVMFVFATIFACLGVVYAVIGCVFTWRYRHTRFVRMSSPRINYLIALGCVFTYVAVILWGIDGTENMDTQQFICTTRVWLLVFGFSLAFGSMFSKTWRVHKIITTKTLQKKIIKDGHLFMLVFGLLALDIIILFLWQVIDPMQWNRILLDMEEDEDEDGIIYQPAVFVCTSSYGSYWSATLYVIKGLLLIFGIFFAWETRKVQIEGLNDSKHIGISVYNIMIASVLTVPLVNILSEDQYNVIYGITVISMLVCSTLTITLVFGTKMYTMLLHGNKVDDMVKTPFQASLQSAVTTKPSPSNAQSNGD